MPRLSHVTVLALALAAGAVIAAVLFRLGATDAVGAVLTMGFIVVLASYFDLLFERTEERSRIGAAFDHIGHAHDQLRSEADLTRRALVELKAHVDDRITARNDRVVSEVKVLESLIQRLAVSIADRAQEIEPDYSDEEEDLAEPYPDNVVAGPMGPDDEVMLDIIRRSLEDNRVDLYLQPVVSLPQRKVRYYEALSRLRAEDGTLIMPSQYIRVAEPAGLMSLVDNVLLFRCIQVVRRWAQRNKDIGVFCNLSRLRAEDGTLIMPSQYIRVAEPAGLMSLVDNVLLFRCIQVVRRWAQRNKDIGVFCNLSRETLRDANFFTQFVDFMQHNRELSGQLIFEISQETFDDIGRAEEANLKLLAELGFSFSMDKVTNLDIDVAKARHYQIRHVKVPAALLLADADDTGASVHPADLKDLLARFGLNLIAERIESERDVVNLLDYNVDFGQGFLFGEPRPIRETVLGLAHPKIAAASLAMARPRSVSGGR